MLLFNRMLLKKIGVAHWGSSKGMKEGGRMKRDDNEMNKMKWGRSNEGKRIEIVMEVKWY